jgi:hypothetical protein
LKFDSREIPIEPRPDRPEETVVKISREFVKFKKRELFELINLAVAMHVVSDPTQRYLIEMFLRDVANRFDRVRLNDSFFRMIPDGLKPKWLLKPDGKAFVYRGLTPEEAARYRRFVVFSYLIDAIDALGANFIDQPEMSRDRLKLEAMAIRPIEEKLRAAESAKRAKSRATRKQAEANAEASTEANPTRLKLIAETTKREIAEKELSVRKGQLTEVTKKLSEVEQALKKTEKERDDALAKAQKAKQDEALMAKALARIDLLESTQAYHVDAAQQARAEAQRWRNDYDALAKRITAAGSPLSEAKRCSTLKPIEKQLPHSPER